MTGWWESFFDAEYLRLWEGSEAPDKTRREVEGLSALLGLSPGNKVLDAPCGYGRISRALAERGQQVLGVDFSQELLAEAERRRGDLPPARLRYRRHDLRTPLPEAGFDVALNIFSSLGYGSEAEDVAILSNLREAVRPGGRVFVETLHRDRVVANLLQNPRGTQGNRLPDDTLLVEEPRLDPVSGRVETTWYWSGPAGSGKKIGSFRVYTATELVRVVEAAGLRFLSAHNGCSTEPFGASASILDSRLGILAAREEP